MELPENNLRILFRVNLIKSVNFATGLRRLFGGISFETLIVQSRARQGRGAGQGYENPFNRFQQRQDYDIAELEKEFTDNFGEGGA